MLASVKNLGQGQPSRDPKHTYGTMRRDLDWNAAKCINGDPSERELLPDADLAKSTKPNCTNQVRRPEDADRPFGCPTIRTDIPYK